MPVQLFVRGASVPVWVFTEDVDSGAIDQLRNVAALPFIHHHVAAMPDVHLGRGATVGSVIPTRGAIIPAAVGVDIGCGMLAVRLSLSAGDLPDGLRSVRDAIERRVPVGFADHGTAMPPTARHFAPLSDRLETILTRHPAIRPRQADKAIAQTGSLGGGNHFIELCLDEAQDVWIMLHSGSRGIGNLIGSYFISRAREAMGDLLGTLPDRELAFLSEGESLFDDYLEAVHWAQDYAAANRTAMLEQVLLALRESLPPFTLTEEAINAHHNYVVREHHYGESVYVTRKGAIRAGKGDLGIIPGSMGARSYIVRGKGSEESFCSCSHGAGRRFSRGEAKRRFSLEDVEAQTQGVECRKDAGVIDELPSAYKDIDEVMANQDDLVEVVHTLKQVLCVKG